MSRPRVLALFPLLLAALTGCAGTPGAVVAPAVPPAVTPAPGTSNAGPGLGQVFTQTNDPGGNAVLVLAVAADGSLSQAASVPTGGRGTGGGLENQASVAVDKALNLLFVTNAASNNFSTFRVDGASLTLIGTTPSGGSSPVSIAEGNGILYVLNDGGSTASPDNISGFSVTASGTVAAIAGSTRRLSAVATAGAQVALSPDGRLAMVTERATGAIETFALDAQGNPGLSAVNASSGAIPFGFQFLDATKVFISEEGANAVSSYGLNGVKTVPITRSAQNFQAATCWLAIAPSGKFLFTTNTAAGSVSAYTVAADGSTALVGTSGVAARATGAPIDAIVDPTGRFLYVVDAGEGVDTFAIAADGSLKLVQNLKIAAALNGIVVL